MNRAMTLLIANVDGPTVWMVADSAITGGKLAYRDREYDLKIEPSLDGRAVVGFAGDHHHGARLMHAAAAIPAGANAIDALLEGHRSYPSVEFAYAYTRNKRVHLFRVSGGARQQLSAFHLGQADAFDHFQRIKHDPKIDFAPEAVKMFLTGSRAPGEIPQTLSAAIVSLLRLIAERSERDVGGWATPYLVTKDGAYLCGYGYSVSDPVLTKIGPGSSVPHGTPEAGGFGLSITEVGHGDGVTVYWLQQPGGFVFIRGANGYERRSFNGRPTEFIERASNATGKKIELWFSEQPASSPQSITVMRDENGIPSTAIAKHGDSFSFSVLNVGTPFRSRATMRLAPGNTSEFPGGNPSTENLTVTLSENKSTAKISLSAEGKSVTELTLTSRDLELIITALGEARAVMSEPVPAEPRKDWIRELVVLDPAWRTEMPVHPTLNGITLRLRHTGFGWLTFLLPWNEARSLGDWLVKHSTPEDHP